MAHSLSNPRLVTLTLCLMAAMAVSAQIVHAGEDKEFGSLKTNITRYTKNVYLGMVYDEAQKLLGAPTQRKVNSNQPGSVHVMWKVSGHFVTASVEPKNNQIIEIGVHWIGKRESLPSYQSILTVPFEIQPKNGAEIIHVDGAQSILHWEVKQIPGLEGQAVSILTITKK